MLAALALCASLTTHAAPGNLDTSFGSGTGKVITAIGSGDDNATALALQPDGKIVVAGYCSNGINSDFCLSRYLPSGALDTNFGTTGKVITAVGPGNDVARALALQPDGKIIVAGECFNGNNLDACLTRYLPSGVLDTSFGTTGTVITALGSDNDSAFALALQPDGRIVVGGYCSINGGPPVFCLARYLPNGALDTSLNTTGKVITPVAAGDGNIRAIALQTDGKIVTAGYCWGGSTYDLCLVRYLTSGALDASFNTTGMVVTGFGSGNDLARAIALQPSGKIVVAGECSNGSNSDFCLARYLPSGALDTSFNATGKVITPIGSGNDVARAIALQPDGAIVVTGHCSNGGTDDFCLARYLPSGALDTNFNTTGKVITAIGSGNDAAFGGALQPDGKIIAAGSCSNGSNADFCLARYEGGPFETRNCSMDIDGDNLVLATTDSLIHARIALGLTGNAVIGGITFASHATRTTWPAIRDYLVTQCGMSIVP
jgi:uncharacterized delta-60 repeat protein